MTRLVYNHEYIAAFPAVNVTKARRMRESMRVRSTMDDAKGDEPHVVTLIRRPQIVADTFELSPFPHPLAETNSR